MDCLRPALLAGGDDLFDHQVAFGRLRRTDCDGAICQFDVERVPVGLRIDGDRLDPQLAGGLDNPAGDFAAIGNQDTLEHASGRCCLRAKSTLPNATIVS